MILGLQWLALAVCVVLAAIRVPRMLRRQNRSLFWIYLSMAFCVALSIPSIYLPVDALLGGENLANVLLRVSLFAVFFLLTAKVAKAYNSPKASRLVRGPVGLCTLALCSAGVWWAYLASDFQYSLTGLDGAEETFSVRAYRLFAVLYPAYAAAVVVGPTAKAAFTRKMLIDRLAALFMCIGFALVVSTALLWPFEGPIDTILAVISFGSILFVAAGLTLVWLSWLRNHRLTTPPAAGGPSSDAQHS